MSMHVRERNEMEIAGLILAGGQGIRMGGVDKGLQLLQDKPLVEHVIQKICPQVQGLWISANRNLDEYREFGFPVFNDLECYTGLGPLAGIASFIPHLPNNITHVQIISCDTPYLPNDLCARLLEGGGDGTYPHDGISAHYSCALVTRVQIQQAQIIIQSQNHSLRSWLQQMGAKPCMGFSQQHFININTLLQLNHG